MLDKYHMGLVSKQMPLSSGRHAYASYKCHLVVVGMHASYKCHLVVVGMHASYKCHLEVVGMHASYKCHIINSGRQANLSPLFRAPASFV